MASSPGRSWRSTAAEVSSSRRAAVCPPRSCAARGQGKRRRATQSNVRATPSASVVRAVQPSSVPALRTSPTRQLRAVQSAGPWTFSHARPYGALTGSRGGSISPRGGAADGGDALAGGGVRLMAHPGAPRRSVRVTRSRTRWTPRVLAVHVSAVETEGSTIRRSLISRRRLGRHVAGDVSHGGLSRHASARSSSHRCWSWGRPPAG